MSGILVIMLILFLFRSMLADIVIIPDDTTSIQAGIDTALDGDTVLVGSGIYDEQLIISGKKIILASYYLLTQDTTYITQTIIDGNNRDFIIKVDSTAGLGTSIIGFTIQNGNDGILPYAQFNLLNNRIINCSDGIDYETGGGGICQDNLFENNSDDGIDLDGSVNIIIENNKIINNSDDGIEIRLHQYSGPELSITIQNNFISGNAEDGIQLIDYPDISDRIFYIKNNLIINNAMAGIGCMSNGNTTENYEGASIIESIYLISNTFYGNNFGVTGGDNLTAKNNIIANCTETAMKNVDNNSLISFSNFWNNGVDFDNCNTDDQSLVYAEPSFVDASNDDFHLTFLSSSIDIGDTLSPKDPDSTIADAGPFYYHQALSDFSLLYPPQDSTITTLNPDFLWQACLAFGEEQITYDLYYSEYPLIPDSLALIIQDISDTSYTLLDTINDFSDYYWKILATNPWSMQKWSDENWNFSVNTDTNPPIFINDLPVIDFNEDDSVFVMNSLWYPYIYDEGTADSLLTFRISQGRNVSVTSNSDTNLFKAGLNWFGVDTLQMSVSDLNNLTTSSSFIVSVNSVNDPPEFHDLPDSISVEYQSSYSFKIWDYVEDIETPDSLLIYRFRSLTDSILINFVDSTGQVEMFHIGYISSTILFVHVTDDSNASIYDSVQINIQEVTGLDPDLENLIPDDFVLKQNYPNPFNPVTTITFGLPEASNVKLEIYNILGQKVLTLFEGKKTPGYHKILWDAYNYSSGLYIYRFSARGKRYSELIKKMILLK